MRNKNVGNQYFEGRKGLLQKVIAAGVLFVLGLLLYFFGWYTGLFAGGWLIATILGSILELVAAALLVGLFTGRITDHNYDEYMQGQLISMWSEQSENEAARPDLTVQEYESVAATRKKKGRDGKIRTDLLCRTEIFEEREGLRIKRGMARAGEKCGDLHSFFLPYRETTASIEQITNKQLSELQKDYLFLRTDSGETVSFPIPRNDYDMEALVTKVSDERRRAERKEAL